MAKESNFKNMVICLTAICLICSALLSGVYALTKDSIEKTKNAKVNSSIAIVVPSFDNDPFADKFTVTNNGTDYTIYPAKKDKEIVGYAVEAFSNKGFSGRIDIMVGFTPDGKIFNTSVISHSETPGLGDKMEQSKSDFALQFNGKIPSQIKMAVKQDGGDIDAISASTISSRAFIDAVQNAFSAFEKINK